MINISNFKVCDIHFILGMWEGLMGGETAHEIAKENAEKWYKQLVSGDQVFHGLQSRWHDPCDFSIQVTTEGGVYVMCYEVVAVITANDRIARNTSTVFMSAVMESLEATEKSRAKAACP